MTSTFSWICTMNPRGNTSSALSSSRLHSRQWVTACSTLECAADTARMLLPKTKSAPRSLFSFLSQQYFSTGTDSMQLYNKYLTIVVTLSSAAHWLTIIGFYTVADRGLGAAKKKAFGYFCAWRVRLINHLLFIKPANFSR